MRHDLDETPPALDDQGDCRVCQFAERARKTELALEDMRTDRNRWRDERRSDAEAEAIESCVRVLDRFLEQTKRTSTSGYTTGSVERVLRYLADRFGVGWYTPPILSAQEENDGR